jgi:hypothetical protein
MDNYVISLSSKLYLIAVRIFYTILSFPARNHTLVAQPIA